MSWLTNLATNVIAAAVPDGFDLVALGAHNPFGTPHAARDEDGGRNEAAPRRSIDESDPESWYLGGDESETMNDRKKLIEFRKQACEQNNSEEDDDDDLCGDTGEAPFEAQAFGNKVFEIVSIEIARPRHFTRFITGWKPIGRMETFCKTLERVDRGSGSEMPTVPWQAGVHYLRNVQAWDELHSNPQKKETQALVKTAWDIIVIDSEASDIWNWEQVYTNDKEVLAELWPTIVQVVRLYYDTHFDARKRCPVCTLKAPEDYVPWVLGGM
ncbi:hypothetical protein B0H63DRAFT_488903 [Podospora didyma]|uniref:Uncharacterized protein n=1 Tax=Podospora didyma TaxID=330526 RepID=A0AAE0K300_9PEZI|nr:hypothetical protein B0H63DRAFT_488903 [Podospora didyma]